MRQVIAIILAALVAVPAFAQTCTQWNVSTAGGGWTQTGGVPGGPWPSKSAAVAAVDSRKKFIDSSNCAFAWGSFAFNRNVAPTGTEEWKATVTKSGPQGCSGSFTTEIYLSPAGQGPCGPECQTGAARSKNLTLGYTRESPAEVSARDRPGGALSAWEASAVETAASLVGTTICDGACSQTVGAPTKAWQSQKATSQGLYRLSADFATTEGGSCSSKSAAADTTAPPPPCVGYVGQIGSRTVCVAAKGAVDPVVDPGKPFLKGNPQASSATDSPLADRTPVGDPGAGDTAIGGGGAGGGPPMTGDGAIRGGSELGDGEAGGEDGGTGTEPIEVVVCGVPGKAPCKMDESGTPNGQGVFDSATAALQQSQTAAIDAINAAAGASGKNTAWTWSFSLPTACSQISLPAFAPFLDSVDVCQFQPVIHDLVSLLWIGATIAGLIALVSATLRGS